MKITFLGIVILAFGLTGFAKSGNENLTVKPIIANVENLIAFSTTDIVKGYLTIKNALVKSNSKAASISKSFRTYMNVLLNASHRMGGPWSTAP